MQGLLMGLRVRRGSCKEQVLALEYGQRGVRWPYLEDTAPNTLHHGLWANHYAFSLGPEYRSCPAFLLIIIEFSHYFPAQGRNWGRGAGRAKVLVCFTHACTCVPPSFSIPVCVSFEASTPWLLLSRHPSFPSLYSGFGQFWVNTGPCSLRRKPKGKGGGGSPASTASVYEVRINQETGINCLGEYICDILTIFIHGFYCDILLQGLLLVFLQHRRKRPPWLCPSPAAADGLAGGH